MRRSGIGLVVVLAALLLSGRAEAQDFIRYYPPASTASGAVDYVGTNSFFIGTGGPTATGQGNTLVGDSAGALIEAGGTENSIFGWLAGDVISTGDYNTAFGAGALSSVTTGSGNVGIGGNALQDYNGSFSTVVGHDAFKDATGDWNTGLGRNAGFGVTTGQQNVAIGKDALGAACAACSYNFALGTAALGNGTTQNSNVAIGHNAGLNNNANEGTFIGNSVGLTCQTGVENVLIGDVANCAAASTERAIAIGTGATAGSFAIAIGRNVSEADSGEIVIQAGTGTRFSTDSVQGSKQKTLTESSATSFTRVAVPQTAAANFGGGSVGYTVYATDGTDSQSLVGDVRFAMINKAGTETCTVGEVGTAVLAESSGASTLTCTFTCATAAADTVDLSANCVSSLVQTTFRIYTRSNMQQVNTYTPQ